MTAGRADFECHQGESFGTFIEVYNPDSSPAQVAAWIPTLHIRRRVISDKPLLECDTENGRLSINENGYTLDLQLSSDDTEALPIGRHVYNLELLQRGNPKVGQDGFFDASSRSDVVVRVLKGYFDVLE